MLTGEHPFRHENMSAVLLAILEQPPVLTASISPQLAQILYRALAGRFSPHPLGNRDANLLLIG